MIKGFSDLRQVGGFLRVLTSACQAEKQQISSLQSLGWLNDGSNTTMYHTRGKHTNYYTNDAVCIVVVVFRLISADFDT